MEPISISIAKDRKDSRCFRVLLVAALLLLSCSGCSRGGNAMRVMTPVTVQKLRTPPGNNLSREHTVVIDLSEAALETGFGNVVDRCMADLDHHCTILESNLSSGQWPAGLIKLRIDPTAVEDLVAFASGLGHLESRSTSVEDLAEAIQDTHARIEMLTTYRKQLLELRAKATTNIEAAIHHRCRHPSLRRDGAAGVLAAGAGGIAGFPRPSIGRHVAGDYGGGVHRAVALYRHSGVVFSAIAVAATGTVMLEELGAGSREKPAAQPEPRRPRMPCPPERYLRPNPLPMALPSSNWVCCPSARPAVFGRLIGRGARCIGES